MHRPHVHVRARALKRIGRQVSSESLTMLKSVEVDGVEWPVNKVSADLSVDEPTKVTLTFYARFTSEVAA